MDATHTPARRASTLTFLGGAGTVTGSKTIVETAGRRVLVDCGLFQGRKELRARNWADFPVDPASIDAVLLTHAHVDHCGYLPRLARAGFAGPVWCTSGTNDLARIVLPDSGHLHEEEAAHANRVGYSKHDPALPLYTEADARACLDLFEVVDVDTAIVVADGVEATWRHNGHILGSASIDVHLTDVDRNVVFSGDLGRPTHPLLAAAPAAPSADVLVTESTYGDRDHPVEDQAERIAEVVSTVAARGGVVVIPAFAVDRTEIILWHLDQLVRAGRIPSLPTHIDSPMASRALDCYRHAARTGSPDIRAEFHGTELFSALQLSETRTVEESKELNVRDGPMIIVSASGMATGGRVLHHLVNRLGDPRNAVVLVGFQAPGTRGDALRRGSRQLKIFGRYRPVRADVVSVELSSHADRTELSAWACSGSRRPGIVYVNHGEPSAAAALADRLADEDDLVVVCPRAGERVLI